MAQSVLPLISAGTTKRNVAQASHGLAVGDVVRHNGTIYVKAQANSVDNAEAIGTVSAVADANNFTLTTGGYVTGLSGLTAGTVYFLDDDTPGLLTATVPTDEGDVIKPLLIADSSTSGYFHNFRGQVIVGGGAAIEYESRSTNTILGTADNGKVIDITAAITQTFEADETLGDGWSVTLRNADDQGTVVITLNPAGSETIDGLTTLTMYAGETRQIICNGAGGNFNSVLLLGGFYRITATGTTTFTLPSGATWVEAELQGGGGGGGGSAGGGAGGGGRILRRFMRDYLGNPGQTVDVNVGVGGTGGVAADGTVGGDTSIENAGGTVVVFAGGGGRGRTNGWRGGGGGGLNEAGQSGTSGASGSIRGGANPTAGVGGVGEAGGGDPDASAPGQPAHYGGGGASGLDLGQGGGTSLYGGGGGGGRGAAGGAGNSFTTTGGGGGAGGTTGGNGADGDMHHGGSGGGGNSSGAAGNGGTPGGGGGGGNTNGGNGGRGEAIIRYG